jgi:O-antigen/teichoic acid export membrane protein
MTSFRLRKIIRRGKVVLASSVNSLLAFPLGLLTSSLVIRLTSPGLWGAVVGVMVIVQLSAHVISWGNQEFLLREISRNPSGLSTAWGMSLRNRLVLAPLALLLFLFAGYRGELLLLSSIWCVGIVLRQSFQPLVVYHRDFTFSIVVDLVTTGLAVLAILSVNTALTFSSAVFILTVQAVLRSSILGVRYLRRDIRPPFRRGPMLPIQYLWLTAPFFLLSFSGMLNSRIDLYLVNLFRQDSEVAIYQILVTVIIFIQSIAALILTPFIKNLYRLDNSVIRGLSKNFFILGLFLVPAGLALAWLILPIIYGFSIPGNFFLAAALVIFPTYGIMPIIYGLYKVDRQVTVLKINFFSVALTTVLSFLLLPVVGLMGAILSAAITRWIALGLYRVQLRRVLMRKPLPIDRSLNIEAVK